MLKKIAFGMRMTASAISACVLMLSAPSAGAAGIGGAGSGGDGVDVRTDYAVSIAGIEIGDAALILRAADGGYEAELIGDFRFLFWTGAAEARSLGGHDDVAGLAPDVYRSRFESPSRIFVTAIDFDGDAPEGRWRTEPPLTGDGFDERVPITKADLVGAKDPLSSFIIPAGSAEDACAGSLKVYSGVVRFDIDLRPSSEAKPSECAGAYRPISGHRATSGEVSRLEREGLTLALFEIAPGYWAPSRLGFKTRFGTLSFDKRD